MFVVVSLVISALILLRQVDRQKLMRVYGALMWSMGKIIRTPEVTTITTVSYFEALAVEKA